MFYLYPEPQFSHWLLELYTESAIVIIIIIIIIIS